MVTANISAGTYVLALLHSYHSTTTNITTLNFTLKNHSQNVNTRNDFNRGARTNEKKDSHITRIASHMLYTSLKYLCRRAFEKNYEIKTMSVRAFFSRNHIRTRTRTSEAIQLWLCFLPLRAVPTTLLAGFLLYVRRLKQATGDPKTQQTRSEQMTYFPIYYREKERGYPYYRPQEC